MWGSSDGINALRNGGICERGWSERGKVGTQVKNGHACDNPPPPQ